MLMQVHLNFIKLQLQLLQEKEYLQYTNQGKLQDIQDLVLRQKPILMLIRIKLKRVFLIQVFILKILLRR